MESFLNVASNSNDFLLSKENYFSKRSNRFSSEVCYFIWNIFRCTFKNFTNECCFYNKKLFFIWINLPFLFEFSFGFVFIVFFLSAVYELQTFRRKIQEKCNWAKHSIKFQLKIFHQKVIKLKFYVHILLLSILPILNLLRNLSILVKFFFSFFRYLLHKAITDFRNRIQKQPIKRFSPIQIWN